MRNWIKSLLLAYISIGTIQAGSGTSGFEFLRTEFSTRAASMGRAFVAMRGDINGLYHNPSGMAYFDQNQFIVKPESQVIYSGP